MLTIRKATLDDSPLIVPLWISSMEFHKKYNSIFQTAPDFRDNVLKEINELLEKTHVAFFLAEKNSAIIGFSMTTINDRPVVFAKPKRGYIGYTYVAEEYRGQGIGSEFIAEIINWFKSQNVDFVDLQVTAQNELGVKFWENNGFKTVNYYMVRELDGK